MTPALQRKELVKGLISVLSAGIDRGRMEDAETVIACVRVMRPKLAELDTFEAWIAMKRGQYIDAIRILRNLDANAPNWALGRALMAFCQFACGDHEWRAAAYEVMESGHSEEAIALVRVLLDPVGSVSEYPQEAPPPKPPVHPPVVLPQGSFLRA